MNIAAQRYLGLYLKHEMLTKDLNPLPIEEFFHPKAWFEFYWEWAGDDGNWAGDDQDAFECEHVLAHLYHQDHIVVLQKERAGGPIGPHEARAEG